MRGRASGRRRRRSFAAVFELGAPMNALRTYDPVGTLKPVASGIWIADGPVIRFRYLGLRLPFTSRMTLVRLADGAIWVHSPTALTPVCGGKWKRWGRCAI